MKIPDHVLTVLRGALTDGDRLHLSGQLERAVYVEVDKTLKAAGFRWHSKRSGGWHELAEGGDAAAVLAGLLGDGTVRTQQETQFFPTPPAVVDRLLDLAQLEPWMEALEPSAGQGAIAGPLASRVAAVDCIELEPGNVAKLRARVPARTIIQSDFLCCIPGRCDLAAGYDRIVMNPPFVRQADIAHVTHALRFLRPGGRLVSVMSAGAEFRDNKTAVRFRDLVEDRGGWIEALPPESFRESGTGINTVIAVVPALYHDLNDEPEPAPAPPAGDRDRLLTDVRRLREEALTLF